MRFKIRCRKDREDVISYISNLNPEKRYEIDITPYRERRSVSQNSLYWLYLGCIEEETGNDRYDLHDFFKRKFLRVGESVLCGEEVVKTISTSKLDTKQFAEYLRKIASFSAQEGIILPDPSDIYFEQFYDQYKHILLK